MSRMALPMALPLATISFKGRLLLMRPMQPCAMTSWVSTSSDMICPSRAGLASATRPWLDTARYWAAPRDCIMSLVSGAEVAAAQAAGRTAGARGGLIRIELGVEVGLRLLERRDGRIHCVVLRGKRRRIGRELGLQRRLLLRDIAQARLQPLVDGRQQAAGTRILVDERVELSSDAVLAAQEIPDGRQIGAQRVVQRGRIRTELARVGVCHDAKVGERAHAARVAGLDLLENVLQLILEGLERGIAVQRTGRLRARIVAAEALNGAQHAVHGRDERADRGRRRGRVGADGQ